MQRGYIKIWRKLEDSGLLQMHSTLALFMYMLMKAAYKPCRYGTANLERGQLVSGRFKLAEALKLSERSTRTCLQHLHDLGMVTSEATNLYTVYTIVNYGKYQDSDDGADQANDQPPTSDRPATDQPPTTIKEVNNLISKEEKKEAGATFVLPDWVKSSDWDLWIKTRKGKKMIPEQMQAQVNKLSKWKDGGLDYEKSLSDAAVNGWQGLFEPKINGHYAKEDSLKRTGDLLTGRIRNEGTITIDMD